MLTGRARLENQGEERATVGRHDCAVHDTTHRRFRLLGSTPNGDQNCVDAIEVPNEGRAVAWPRHEWESTRNLQEVDVIQLDGMLPTSDALSLSNCSRPECDGGKRALISEIAFLCDPSSQDLGKRIGGPLDEGRSLPSDKRA